MPISSGDKLSIALVDNAAAAADVLAWCSGTSPAGRSKALRVWDLQRLQSYDKLQQQKRAQAHFPPGGNDPGVDVLPVWKCPCLRTPHYVTALASNKNVAAL